MACIYVVEGWCRILDKKCNNCCNNHKEYFDSLKLAVEKKKCPHLGNYAGARSCNCPHTSLMPAFYCEFKDKEITAKYCLNCPITPLYKES